MTTNSKTYGLKEDFRMKNKYTSLAAAVAFLLNCIPLQAAAPEGYKTLESLVADDGAVVMSLTGNVKYHAFKISNPSRVVVELTNTEYGAKTKEISVGGELVKRVRGGQFKDSPTKITRIVVDLSAPCDYQLQGSGKTVTLKLKAKKAQSKKSSTQPVASKATEPAAPVKVDVVQPAAVEQTQTAEPAAQATVAAAAPSPEQKVSEPAKGNPSPSPVEAVPASTTAPKPAKTTAAAKKKRAVKAVAKKAPTKVEQKVVPAESAPETPAEKADVAGDAPQAVAATPAPAPAVDETQVVVAAPLSDDEQKKLSEKPIVTPPPAQPAKPAKQAAKPAAAKKEAVSGTLSKKPISLDFEDADIRDVLRVLSLKSGVNIIYGPDVSGTITLRLDNVPFDKAFETILALRGMVAQEQGSNIIRVATPTKIAEERAAAVTFTKVYPLNYAKAEEVKANLDSIRMAEGRRGNISNDARTNSLIITDTPEGLASIERIIAELDKRPAQVLIEAKIVEVVLTNSYDLGIQWQYASTLVNDANSKVYVGGTKSETTSSALGSGAVANATVVSALTTSEGGTGVSFPASSVNGQVASIAFGIISNDTLISGVLSALAQKGLSKILSNPKVTTINNKEAKILVGQRIPYTTTTVTTTGSTQSTSFLDVGVKLTVTPTINVDQKITLAVHPEVSLYVRADAAGPVVGTREAQTTVLVGSGQTVVIGGLITEQDQKTATQVPLLGDIPIIGQLFRRDYNSKERSELLVFLTPQIINND